MKDFLNEYIVSLSSKRQTRVFDILSASRVAKEDTDTLSAKLADIKKEAPIVIALETFGSKIRSQNFDAAYRDVYRRTLELFESSNVISLLLDTHTSMLSSEIKALEDELFAMEKMVNNYAFMLSDNGFYDYAFMETFNDDTMMEAGFNIPLTDRSGNDFTGDEMASINSASGTLTLNPALKFSYPLEGHVLDSNCLALSTSDTGLENSLNASVSNGWRIALASPKPISSHLTGIVKPGAQIELELVLRAPAPCDTIVLTPFSDIPMEVMKIVIIAGTDDADSRTVLDSLTILDRPMTFNFPLQSVSRFRIIVNQSVYSRGELPPVKEQVVYRDFYSSLKQERATVAQYMGKDYNKNKKALKRVFVNSMKDSSNHKVFKAEIPQLNFEATHGPLTIDKIVRGKNEILEYKSKMNVFMRKMIDDKIFPNNDEILNDRRTFNVNSSFGNTAETLTSTSQTYPRIIGVEPPIDVDILSYSVVQEKKYLDYQYNLGLRNIQIGTGDQIYRGVFITKQIPAPSGTGEVKLKVDEINFQILDTSKDMNTITSIEYSISNKSFPKSEQDWIPIIPIDTPKVIGERMFPDEAGLIYFRFPVDMNGSYIIYKNGYRVSQELITEVMDSTGNAIKGIRTPITTFTASDIFTSSYTPYGDQAIINFEAKGFGQSLLASAYDDTGAGETFQSTFNNQIITLIYEPYVSYDRINAEGSYSQTFGFQGTYQPITVVLSDGTVALNQTNYLGITQNNLSTFDETKTAYIHSSNNIIFNKPIDKAFTVYYQYIPSNLRLRIIMRVNDINYVSPILNSAQIKAKTLKANARKVV